MRKLVVLASALALRAWRQASREEDGAEQPASDRETRAVVDAALAFLKTLRTSNKTPFSISEVSDTRCPSARMLSLRAALCFLMLCGI
jgi:hypothetical protein